MRIGSGKGGLLALAAAMVFAGAAMAAGPAESIAARQALMRGMGQAAGKLRSSTSPSGSLADAKQLAELAGRLPTLFPPGSDAGDTQALKTVWTDPAGFATAVQNLQTATGLLAAAAQADDKTGFANALKQTGAACGACHASYRAH
jgi:cytochrome c556